MQVVRDYTHLKCPMPLLELKLLLKQYSEAKEVELQVADKSSIKDIPAWSEMKGYICKCKLVSHGKWQINITIGKVN